MQLLGVVADSEGVQRFRGAVLNNSRFSFWCYDLLLFFSSADKQGGI